MMRIARHSLLALALYAAVSCGEGPTEPEVPDDVNILISITSQLGPSIVETADGPMMSCTVALTAAATGRGKAMWLEGRFRFFYGKDKEVLDSATVSSGDIARAWGNATIAALQSQKSQWRSSASIPFSGDFVFRYLTTGSTVEKSQKVTFSCSPSIAPDAAPPSITSITVTPPSGSLSAGAPLTVAFTASAPAGLWETVLQVSGPCSVEKRFTERLSTSTTHSVTLQLPQNCRLGVPITVAVDAIDAAAQVGADGRATQLVLADLDPPTMFVSLTDPYGNNTLSGGDFFVGDALNLLVSAADNYKLEHVVWEILPSGIKDSFTVNEQGFKSLSIPIRPEWVGPIQMRLYATDSVGLRSTPILTATDSLRVHPTVTPPTRTVTIGGQMPAIAIDERRGVLYMLQGVPSRLVVLSLASMTVVDSLALPAYSSDLDLTPSGDSLVICTYAQSSLGIVNLRSATLALSTLPFTSPASAPGMYPLQARVLSNGHVMVSTVSSDERTAGFIDINLATGAQRMREDAMTNGTIGQVSMERSLDASVLVMSDPKPPCARRYDVSTDTFSACVRPRVIGRPSVDATGQRFAFSNDVYDASLQKLPQLGPAFLSVGAIYNTLSADGQSLYDAYTSGLIKVNANDGRIAGKVANQLRVNMPPRFSADGKTLVLFDRGNTSTTIAVLDLR